MKVVFTGGGTGGHVIPNIALIDELKKDKNVEILYIGSKEGIEKKLIEEKKIRYLSIETGKLRRYISKKNIEDFFKVFKGIKEAREILKKEKPDVVFSKGGFVSVPVVLGAAMNKIPVIIHESDMTPGLANKISIPFASKVCVSFPETINNVSKKKAILTGSPVRKEIFLGSKEEGKKFVGVTNDKPIITIMGGSLGSKVINDAIREIIDKITKDYNIVHLCGKDKVDNNLKNVPGYYQFEYVNEEMKDIFAMTDLFITRAGANSIFEILLLEKPSILIPLSKKASRGDQILNANSFAKQGFSIVLEEENVTKDSLKEKIEFAMQNKNSMKNCMKQTSLKSGTDTIIDLIKNISTK